MLDARTQVRELCHGSAAEESGCVELSANRVDLGRSNILGGRAELEVDLQVGTAGVEEVSREHNGTGLRSRSGELTLLGREEVLADGLCLGETVALVLGADIKRGVLGHGRENLDHVEAVKGQSSALLLTVLGSHGTDAIFDVSHVRRLVVALPEAHGWGELEVVVPDTLMLHGVVACAEGKLVGNNKVEGDCICAASLEDTIAGEVCRAERHAELHEGTRSVVGAGILADKINTGVGSASEEDLKAKEMIPAIDYPASEPCLNQKEGFRIDVYPAGQVGTDAIETASSGDFASQVGIGPRKKGLNNALGSVETRTPSPDPNEALDAAICRPMLQRD